MEEGQGEGWSKVYREGREGGRNRKGITEGWMKGRREAFEGGEEKR